MTTPEGHAAASDAAPDSLGRRESGLLVDVAHDMRSPLTSILFLAEALRARRGHPIEATQERQLMLIYSAAFELRSLADDLTELARGGAHLLERRPIPFAVEEVLRSVRDMVHPIAEERGVDLRLRCEPGTNRFGHPAALGRVLRNLATNALRGTDEGFVEIAAEPLSREHVRFHVRDTGRGVPDDVAAMLGGSPDVQAPSATHRFSSAGLGLMICRRLLASLGSDLELRPTSDAGACFTFVLEMPDVGAGARVD